MSDEHQFLDRRHSGELDYDIAVRVTGVKCFDDKVHWHVEVDGEDDPDEIIGMLERAIEVMQKKKAS